MESAFPVRFRRLHSRGPEAFVREWVGWHVHIDLGEEHQFRAIDGFLDSSPERAKHLADREILKHGHVCNDSCNDWTSPESCFCHGLIRVATQPTLASLTLRRVS